MGGGGKGSFRRSPPSGGAKGRAKRDARVVWPPQEREGSSEAIERMMRERGLSLGFERAVERDAQRAREDVQHSADVGAQARGRLDLRELPTFTIDPSSAHDFDDAISAQRGGEGRTIIWVHIADVSAYVEEGSCLDEEAQRRGTSVYAPGVVEPMLPGVLCNDACSLLPGADRLTVSVELELEGERLVRTAFHRSLIRSDERLDYERVQRIFSGQERTQEPWGAALELAREGARALELVRLRRTSALSIATAEPAFGFDTEGNVREIVMRSHTESHRLIEALMIAANEAVARTLLEHRIPCLYRVHASPEPASVKRLADQLVSLEVPVPPVPERLGSTEAAQLLGELSRRVEAHVASHGGRLALNALVLRALEQAFYSPRNIGHAGLGSHCYCHFTSPIRRYPDLVCHRALLHTIGAVAPAPRAGELVELGEWCSEREREAMTIERDGDDIARCYLLEAQLLEHGYEQVFDGEIVGLISAGLFVAFLEGDGGEPLFEGMLPVRHLRGEAGEKDWWELGEGGTILRAQGSGSRLRLGERIEVAVASVDASAGRVSLLPAPGPRAAG